MDAARALPTIAELLHGATARLQAAGIATARLDVEVLLALALGTDRAGLYAQLPSAAPSGVTDRFATLLDRRARREPIAYITGVQEFWSLPFEVNASVLIPRPETELVVEIVCRHVRTSARPHVSTSARHPGRPLICDVGTGSGCIAVALARELPAARIVATDTSADALATAARNAAAHGVADRITFLESDLLSAIPAEVRFDVIASNPPYCRPTDSMSTELAYEPRSALAAGPDGMDVIHRLIPAAFARLRDGGRLAMEFGIAQDEAVRRLAHDAGFAELIIEPDLAGIPRVLVARRP